MTKNSHEGTKARRHEGYFLRAFVPSCLRASPLLFLSFLLVGCTTPNKANILLRKQNQDLRDRIANLEQANNADRAKIVSLEAGDIIPSLPPKRLDQLYTVHGLRIGRLTGGAQLDPNKPGDQGLRVYVVPTDQDGEDLKAAGAFTIEAFDLAKKGDQKIGQWNFDVAQAKKDWYGSLLYSYVLGCPWQIVPQHPKLTVTIAFTDALTGRRFQVQRVVEVQLPGQ